mgnify:CR=1 FL=1
MARERALTPARSGLAPGAVPRCAGAAMLGEGICPLEAMRDFHHRQRQTCADLEAIAGDPLPDRSLAMRLLVELCHDMRLHHADEDCDLFPLLRRRARPEDEIETLLARLEAEHRQSAEALPSMLRTLAAMATGRVARGARRRALAEHARAHRRHMIIENAIVLPLACMRLTTRDRRGLMLRMRTRRAAPPGLSTACRKALGAVLLHLPEEML